MELGPGLSSIIVMQNMKQTKAKYNHTVLRIRSDKMTMNEVDGLIRILIQVRH